MLGLAVGVGLGFRARNPGILPTKGSYILENLHLTPYGPVCWGGCLGGFGEFRFSGLGGSGLRASKPADLTRLSGLELVKGITNE